MRFYVRNNIPLEEIPFMAKNTPQNIPEGVLLMYPIHDNNHGGFGSIQNYLFMKHYAKNDKEMFYHEVEIPDNLVYEISSVEKYSQLAERFPNPTPNYELGIDWEKVSAAGYGAVLIYRNLIYLECKCSENIKNPDKVLQALESYEKDVAFIFDKSVISKSISNELKEGIKGGTIIAFGQK